VNRQDPLPRRQYPSDLSDAEWSLIEAYISPPLWFPPLQEPQYPARELLNAMRYRTRTGVAWRSLPHDLPQWSTVFKWYQRWTKDGTLERVHDHLRRLVRVDEGRTPEPTAAILDSQSVKSTDVGGPKGFDAGKKGERAKAARGRRYAGADSRASHHTSERPRP
jgi:putative transposase